MSATSAVSSAVSDAGRAHRDPEVGERERGRVVDAVAHHRHRSVACLQLAHRLDLVLGQQPRPVLGEPRVRGDRRGGTLVVAREHHDVLDAGTPQCGHDVAGLRTYLVRHRDEPDRDVRAQQHEHRLALRPRAPRSVAATSEREPTRLRGESWTADRVRDSIDVRPNALAGQVGEPSRRGSCGVRPLPREAPLPPPDASSPTRARPRWREPPSRPPSPSGTTSVTSGRPHVSVPVLSNATARTFGRRLQERAALRRARRRVWRA